MTRPIGRNRRRAAFLLAAFSACLTVLMAEAALKVLLPFNLATIGHQEAENARLYGWGFRPHERITRADPDTGEIYEGRASNHGWRDRDRHFANETNAYRILVLGDSSTFGAIVPAERVYTRVLERRLNEEGFDVEVINIAYGGWGTDQELEALRIEGLKYRPNLVIIQFDTNDLKDNAYFETGAEDGKGRKPFYYRLEESGELVRHDNPYFMMDRGLTWKDRAKNLIGKSEILKRVYALYVRRKLEHMANIQEDQEAPPKYAITENQLQQLELALDPDGDAKFLSALRSLGESDVTEDRLVQTIAAWGLDREREIILRLLEHRWFHACW